MGAVVAAVALCAAPAAQGKVVRAEGVLPPGQSGFVSATGVADGTGSPHLYDQQPLFSASSASRSPSTSRHRGDPARRACGSCATRSACPRSPAPPTTTRGGAPATRSPRTGSSSSSCSATRRRAASPRSSARAPSTTTSSRGATTTRPPSATPWPPGCPPTCSARAEAYRDGINAWIGRARLSPPTCPASTPRRRAADRDWTVRRLARDRRLPRAHRPERRRPASCATCAPSRRPARRCSTSCCRCGCPGRSRRSRAEGRFPQGKATTPAPGARGRSQRSLAFAKTLPTPSAAASRAALRKAELAPGRLGRVGGSYMFAVRETARRARRSCSTARSSASPSPSCSSSSSSTRPGLDVRGVTAPGVPVIGIGHNGNVAWGFTSGLSDEDDLYAEQLVGGPGAERYALPGRAAPDGVPRRDLQVPHAADGPAARRRGPGARGRRPSASAAPSTGRCRCATATSPTRAATRSGAASSRRSSGSPSVNAAQDRRATSTRAMQQVTWNENLMAADSQGNIGYWHPGLCSCARAASTSGCRCPGTGEAEWPGLVDREPDAARRSTRKQGWLANWNNIPSQGWTTGDGEATERVTGPLHRDGWLQRLVRRLRQEPTFEGAAGRGPPRGHDRAAAPAPRPRLRARASAGARGGAAVVLDDVLALGRHLRPRRRGQARSTRRRSVGAVQGRGRDGRGADAARCRGAERFGDGHRARAHVFDITNGRRTRCGRSTTASCASRPRAPSPARRSGSERRPGELARAAPDVRGRRPGRRRRPPLPFFDRGTWEQIIELGR